MIDSYPININSFSTLKKTFISHMHEINVFIFFFDRLKKK